MCAAILMIMDNKNNPKIDKFNNSQRWRLQFWIFLPFIWLKDKSSYHLFFTLSPIPIQIWFDLCFHHIWMLLLCIVFIIYPYYINNDNDNMYKQNNMELISSIMYIITFSFIFIVTMYSFKIRFNLSTKN